MVTERQFSPDFVHEGATCLKIVVARSAAEMERLKPAWQTLAATQSYTIFQSFEWNRLAAGHFASREAPFVVMAESDSGSAIVPAAIAYNSELTLLGEMLFDYRDYLHAGAVTALASAFEQLARLGCPLSVTAIRGEHRAEAWRPLQPASFCRAPGVRRADMTADEFASEHNRLGRQLRRLTRQKVELRQCDGRSSSLLRHIYDQKSAQFNGSGVNIFGDWQRAQFLVAAAAMDASRCEIFTLETASQLVAALVTFRDGDVRRFYTIYFNPAWGEFSPGTVLVYVVTQRSLAEGVDCDYMTGEQPHKMRLARSFVPLYRLQAGAESLSLMARTGGVELAA